MNPPSLLIVTIDTWRWDHIGLSGQNKVATPHLDRLGREGVYEGEVLTPCPLTTPAHATLFTGRFPLRHRVLDCTGYRLPDTVPTLAEAFTARGYRTAAFVSAETLLAKFGLDRGFGLFDDTGIRRRRADDWLQGTKDGRETTRAALRWLALQEAGKPLMLWVHYFDLHAPYRRRPEWDRLYPGNNYAAAAAFVDGELGALLEALRLDGSRAWRVVVVGDHGEGFGDRGERGHGIGLYRSTMHVPLLIHPAPDRPLRHKRPWHLADIAPMLTEWFGLWGPADADGESLFAPGAAARALPMLSILPSLMFGVNPALGVREGTYHYLLHGEEELFDQASDPALERDRARDPDLAPIRARLRRACRSAFPASLLQEVMSPTLRTTRREMETLRSLGYLGGRVPDIAKLQRADLKALLLAQSRMESGREESFRSGKPEPLVVLYREFLQQYPRAKSVWRNLGRALIDLQRFPEALQAYDRAFALDDTDLDSMVNLGTLHMFAGHFEKARQMLERAASADPNDTAVHKNLGILYEEHLQDPAMAVRHYQRYLQLDPESPERQRIEAFIRKHGKPAGKGANKTESQ